MYIVQYSMKFLIVNIMGKIYSKSNESEKVLVVRWIARVSSGIAAAFILLFFIGEGLSGGFESLLDMTARETLMMVSFAALWLGLLLGWKWELYGGLITACGVTAFYLVNYLFSGKLPRGPYFLIFAFPGLLFLYCGLRTRTKPGAQSA